MNRLKSFCKTLIFGCCLVCMAACSDDFPGISSQDLLDGETTLCLEASFAPFSEGKLTRATNTPPGRGFNVLSDLVIIVYDKDGNIVKDIKDLPGGLREIKFSPEDINDEERNKENPGTSNDKPAAESDSKSLKDIKLRLPFGEYYVIGVANFGVYDNDGNVTKSTYTVLNEMGEESYSTLDALRKIKVTWDNTNYCNNREMMGYFTEPDAQTPRGSLDFQTLKVNRSGMTPRAWLRRCASKITVDFDGSGLRDNIYVYIKDVRIYDLAKDCTLGFGASSSYNYNNSVTDDENGLINKEFDAEGKPLENDYVVDYRYDDKITDNFVDWPCITKGSPYIKDSNGNKVDFHTQNSAALYFYENMQGTHDDKDRTPLPDLNDGGVKDGYDRKDGVNNATYIVVNAHYHSDADGNIADYDVKYRFVLGKDVTTNYDAERNYHYKLTLKFRGNANEYHWHIDYDEPEGFDVPNPWYVSYLYNHDAMLPFKYTPGEDWEVDYVEAEIEKNPWYPSTLLDSELIKPDAEIPVQCPAGDDGAPYEKGAISFNDSIGNGFLSLRETTDIVITDEIAAKAAGKKNWADFGGYNATSVINQPYFTGGNGTIERHRRTYYLNGSDASNKGRERYTWNKDGDKVTMNIPLFTRAKIMVKQTGFSGNNPFVGYQRTAKLKLLVHLKNKKDNSQTKTDETKVNVVQVRRVVNPKGVYRREGNNESFHAKMMWLAGDDATSFTPAISHGPWRAEIIGDPNFITLDGKQTVSGATNTEIDFTIRFNRINTKKVKNAVVRILYHNYTCTHLIFVRQGYDPQELASNGKQYPLSGGIPTVTNKPVKWETFNMIAEDVMATDPRDEGSMFKFGNYTEPIDAINNAYKNGDQEYYTFPAREQFVQSAGDNLKLAKSDGSLSETTKSWSNISSNGNGFSGANGKIKNAATMRSFEQLYLTDNVQFGYGVLYADGATETQAKVDDAYGYSRYDTANKKNGDSKKGMRGLFAYYWDRTQPSDPYNARNVFFPIGRSGYGHRKNSKEGENDGKGILRYSSIRYRPTIEDVGGAGEKFPKIAPLFVSIYRRPGAIYWARNTVADKNYLVWNGKTDTEGVGYGLDINYFSFDVNSIAGVSIDDGRDACFVRTIVE